MGYISSPSSGIPYFDFATLISTIYVPIYVFWMYFHLVDEMSPVNAASVF